MARAAQLPASFHGDGRAVPAHAGCSRPAAAGGRASAWPWHAAARRPQARRAAPGRQRQASDRRAGAARALMVRLVDTHCHLHAAEFDPDRDPVVARASAAVVRAQVVPATEADAWPGLRDVCAAGDGLHAAYGLHPTFLAHHGPAHLEELGEWIERERPVAVGECGLDYWV